MQSHEIKMKVNSKQANMVNNLLVISLAYAER